MIFTYYHPRCEAGGYIAAYSLDRTRHLCICQTGIIEVESDIKFHVEARIFKHDRLKRLITN